MLVCSVTVTIPQTFQRTNLNVKDLSENECPVRRIAIAIAVVYQVLEMGIFFNEF